MFGLFFLPLFFSFFFLFVGGGGLRDTVGFYPQEVRGKLAVVNEPKWSPVIHSLICPLGARERSDGWGLITAPGP